MSLDLLVTRFLLLRSCAFLGLPYFNLLKGQIARDALIAMVARGAYQIYQGVQHVFNERAPESQPQE
jgi:hypothetical protein